MECAFEVPIYDEDREYIGGENHGSQGNPVSLMEVE